MMRAPEAKEVADRRMPASANRTRASKKRTGKKRAAKKKGGKAKSFSPHRPAPHIAYPASPTEIIDQLGLSPKRKAVATSIVDRIIAKLGTAKRAAGG